MKLTLRKSFADGGAEHVFNPVECLPVVRENKLVLYTYYRCSEQELDDVLSSLDDFSGITIVNDMGNNLYCVSFIIDNLKVIMSE